MRDCTIEDKGNCPIGNCPIEAGDGTAVRGYGSRVATGGCGGGKGIAMVSRVTRTSAHCVLEHRLGDAVKWWETPVDRREGPAPVVGTTADGRKKGQPSTAEIACHIGTALYRDLAREHAGQREPTWVLPEPPPCWRGAGCDPRDTLTQVGTKVKSFVEGPTVYATTDRTVEENGLLAARFVLTCGQIPHARAWRERLGDYGQPTNARGKPLGETMLAAGQQPPYACKASVSGMAGTPSCFANICKCHGGFIAERRVEEHFNTAGQRRHNEAWAAKLGAQKRTAALFRKSGGEVPAKLRRKIKDDDVMSATETVSSASGFSNADWANMRRGNAEGADREEVATERHKHDPHKRNQLDRVLEATHYPPISTGQYPSAEAVSTEIREMASVRTEGVAPIGVPTDESARLVKAIRQAQRVQRAPKIIDVWGRELTLSGTHGYVYTRPGTE